MDEFEDKWERYEQERLLIKPETLSQLEMLAGTLRLSTVDEVVQLLMRTQNFSLQVTNMVETLQQNWQGEEPLEVVTRLVREVLDRLEREETLLVLLAELEASGVTDPVGYLRGLVQDQERQRGEALVNYQRLPYSHLIGIQTPGAMRERWRRAVWTIMQYNQQCSHYEHRWYINSWAVAALAGGLLRPLSTYLQDMEPLLRKHHLAFEVHPNVNRKDVAISDVITIAEEPLPDSPGWNLWMIAPPSLPDQP